MNSSNTKFIFLLVPFGFAVYLLDVLFMPHIGMVPTQVISAVSLLILLVIFQVLNSREQDERERMMQLQSDSTALFTVIGGLLAGTIFYPHSDIAMVFWFVLALAVGGRVFSFFYQRYK